MVNLLMRKPFFYLQVGIALMLIEDNAPFPLQLEQPLNNVCLSVVIIGVEKAREHSRGRASPPVIIHHGEQHEE